MCKQQQHTSDKRILKARKGEMISINAESLCDSDIAQINDFIRFARAFSKAKSELDQSESTTNKTTEK